MKIFGKAYFAKLFKWTLAGIKNVGLKGSVQRPE